jgi:hypothetical protein
MSKSTKLLVREVRDLRSVESAVASYIQQAAKAAGKRIELTGKPTLDNSATLRAWLKSVDAKGTGSSDVIDAVWSRAKRHLKAADKSTVALVAGNTVYRLHAVAAVQFRAVSTLAQHVGEATLARALRNAADDHAKRAASVPQDTATSSRPAPNKPAAKKATTKKAVAKTAAAKKATADKKPATKKAAAKKVVAKKADAKRSAARKPATTKKRTTDAAPKRSRSTAAKSGARRTTR